MPRRTWPLLIFLPLTACRSAQTRNADLLADRAEKLKPLSAWTSTWCRVDARLTGPALARYRAIFPFDVARLDAGVLPYTWKATRASCEVTPLDQSPLATNALGFLDVALCTLIQTHFVNSPFTDLKVEALESRDGRTFVRTGEDAALGLSLDPDRVAIETRTRGRGTLDAEYRSADVGWVPSRLSQRLPTATIVVDRLEYEEAPGGRGHPRLKSFALAVGEAEASPHSEVDVSECQPL